MYGLGHIANVRPAGGGVSSQFVTDFGVVELPPKLHAELERIDAHLKRQFKVLATQFANNEPLAMEDLSDPESDRPSTLTAVRIGGTSDVQSQTA